MSSTPNPKAIEPDGVLIARADERLAHAYGQIARADEQLARVTEQLSKLEHDAPRYPSAVLGRKHSRGWPALRGLVGSLLAASIFIAAFVSQSSYGDAAKLTVARWVPQLNLLPLEKGLPAQSSQSTVQVAAPEPALPAQTARQDVVPTAGPVSPELAQLLETMARDLTYVKQGIEQLKTSQEQMAIDNTKAVEQLKAGQEQMTRLIAKASEQNLSPKSLSPKASAPLPRPTATPARKPRPTLPSPQARARAPKQLQPEEQ
ncbi:hypothetical protein SAMN05444050_2613 [Afipia sp. GAS231]|nr:hypothetical protein SAMN05444050_2613 [Afipia sp. GAS231]